MKFIRVVSIASLACLLTAAAWAQIAPPRSWPELKEAVLERVDRNAYPLTGMRPADVREILGQIGSLDRDEWAAAWSRMGDRYNARAGEFERSDRAAAAENYLMAYRYYAFGGWPAQNAPGQRAA